MNGSTAVAVPPASIGDFRVDDDGDPYDGPGGTSVPFAEMYLQASGLGEWWVNDSPTEPWTSLESANDQFAYHHREDVSAGGFMWSAWSFDVEYNDFTSSFRHTDGQLPNGSILSIGMSNAGLPVPANINNRWEIEDLDGLSASNVSGGLNLATYGGPTAAQFPGTAAFRWQSYEIDGEGSDLTLKIKEPDFSMTDYVVFVQLPLGESINADGRSFTGPNSLSDNQMEGLGMTDEIVFNWTIDSKSDSVGGPNPEYGNNIDPAAIDDTASIVCGVPAVIDILANDNDVTGGGLTPTLLSTGSNGTFVLNPNNTVTYTANPGFWPGSDTASYEVVDSQGSVSTANITVTGPAGMVEIAGRVFEDLDSDGVRDSGETGPAGVTVRLYDDANNNGIIDDGAPIATQTTGAGGSYSFMRTATVGSTVSENLTITQTNNDAYQLSNGTVERNVIEESDDVYRFKGYRFPSINIPAGATITSAVLRLVAWDDGEIPVTIRAESAAAPGVYLESSNYLGSRPVGTASQVWSMPDLRDIRDDPFLSPDFSNVVQETVDSNGGITHLSLILSNTTGTWVSYSVDDGEDFPQLAISYTLPGDPLNFLVNVNTATLPANTQLTTDNIEAANFSDVSQIDCGNDFGFESTLGSIAGSVLVDDDNNGSGDSGLGGVTVALVNNSGTTVATTVTAANGSYLFSNVTPGTYTILETQPTGFLSVSDVDGGNPDLIGDVTAVVLPPNGAITDQDFIEVQGAALGGTVRADTTGNGTGDTPISGVTIEVLNDGGVVIATTITAPNGTYSVTGLIPGDYTVRETDPSGFTSLTPNLVAVNLPPGVTGQADFDDVELGSIAGTVLADTTGNDIGDTPLPGVLVTLQDASGNDIDSDPGTAGIQPTTTTTDGNGDYLFGNLPPGSYQVEETQPAGYDSLSDVDGGDLDINGDVTPITLLPGTDVVDQDFTEVETGSISGTVLADTTGDDIGDTPLPGVLVTLQDASGNDIDSDPGTAGIQPTTTATDANGDYLFSGLPPGSYQVVETQPAGYDSLSDVDGGDLDTNGDVTPIAVAPGVDVVDQDFTEVETGSISGTVLADTTGDDIGDTPLPGVLVTLKDASGNDIDSDPGTAGIQPTTAITDINGDYTFGNLPPGDYQVVETQPAGYNSLSDVDGGDLDTNGDVTPISVPPGTNVVDQDFTEVETGSISGTVLADTTGDDIGDTPLPGVLVTLQDASGNDVDSDPGTAGTQPTTTTTDVNGDYSFVNLPPGDYQVVETQPAGYDSLLDVDGGDLDINGDVTPITVLPGAAVVDQDFTEVETGSISGTILADTTGDDIGDTPLPGVFVTLQDASGNDIDSDPGTAGTQPTTTTTDGNGDYSFVNLPPGDYQVVETQPAGYDSLLDVDGGDLDINGDVTPIAVTPGADVVDQDFTEVETGSISGTVLADTTGNDIGDTPLPGVLVTLQDASGNDIDSDPGTAGIQPTTTTTDANGDYTFGNLPPGDYQVVETQPAGYDSVSDVDGGDLDTNGDVTPIIVLPGIDVVDQDFTEVETGSISGTVLADTTGNDIGDTPLPGVLVTLQDTSGNDIDSDPGTAGIQPTTTTTDANGDYLFGNLPPGDYQVVETQPAGYDSVSDVDGGDLDTNGDVTPIAVTPGADVVDQDFTEVEVGSISGTVLADTTGDDIGDTPLPGVFVTLQDASGNDIDSDPGTAGIQPTTITTDANGDYTFGNLPPGDYQVVETQPAGYDSLSDVDGGDLDTNGDVTPITVVPGANVVDQDFAEVETGSISGTVLADTTGDGTGDTPIEGVTVTLTDGSGNVIDSDPVTAGTQPATTTTDVNGDYLFSDLSAGDYTVVETQPSGYNSVSDVDGGDLDINGDQTVITLLPGTDVTDQDFVEIELGSIRGTVLADTTGDGAGDTPLEGVTLTLTDGSGSVIDSDPATAGIQPTTTTTDVNGDYLFSGLPVGDYTVVETQPIDYVSLGDIDGGDLDINGDVVVIELLPGTDVVDQDFLEGLATGSIAGTVFDDTDCDDLANDPLVGVALELRDDSNTLIGSTATLADGSYIFTGLPAGSYTVVKTPLVGYIPVNDIDGGDLNINGDVTAIVLATGSSEVTDQDFVDRFTDGFHLLTDTDGDVFSLSEEYTFGGDPASGNHLVVGTARRAGMTIEENGTGGIDISYVRFARRGDAIVIPYVSHDPRDVGNWTAVAALPTVTDNGDGTETVKWANIHDIDGNLLVDRDRGFVRLFVDPCFLPPSWTLVQGWHRSVVDGKRQTHGRNFSSMPVFTGFIDSASASTITTTTSGKGVDLGTYLTEAAGLYYLELTSGPSEGERFDLASGGIDSFTLNLASINNTLATLPAGLGGSHFVIRRHETLGEIYPNSEWDASGSVGSADQVLLYGGNGYNTYYNLSLTQTWIRQGSGFTSQNGLIIAPGTGMLVVHASPVDVNEILQFGDLRYNDFRRPLSLGTTGLNFTSQGYPFDATPAELNMTQANGFLGATSAGSATQILNWAGDTVVNSPGWTTNFLLSLGGDWRTQGALGNVTTNSPLFKIARSAQIDVQQDKLDWIHPLPWDVAPWEQPLVFVIEPLISSGPLMVAALEAGPSLDTEGGLETATSYEQWVKDSFVSDQSFDGDLTSPDADFDADGRSNFLEYAVGSDPTVKDPAYQISLSPRGATGAGFEIKLQRAPGRLASWQLEVSDDLVSYTPVVDGAEISVAESDHVIFTVFESVQSNRYFRVRVIPAR